MTHAADKDVFKAIYAGDLNKINSLINQGVSIHDKNHLGESTLSIACSLGNFNIARLLIQQSADVNYKNMNQMGVTPLMICAQRGHLDIMKLLLDHGADINFSIKLNRYLSISNTTAFLLAAQGGHQDCATLLINKGFNINKTYSKNLETLLMRAVINDRDLELAEALLKLGADPNIKNKGGETPLFLAVTLKDESRIKLLVDYKADPDIDNHGETARKLAKQFNLNYIEYADSLAEQKELLTKINDSGIEISASNLSL